MLKLPSFQDIANVSPTIKRDPGVTAPVEAFRSGMPVEELAPGLRVVADVVKQEEIRKDQAAVNERRRELLEFETEQNEWLSQQKGENAFKAKAQLDKAVDARLAQIRGSLKNDRQKNAFKEVEGDWRASLNRAASRVIAAEMDRHYDDVDNKLVETSSRAAQKAASLGDFARVQQEWADQEKVIAGYADRKGLDETQRKAMLDRRKSDYHAGIVKQLIADGSTINAKKYLDANRSEFDANDVLALGKSLEISSNREMAQTFADEAEASNMSEAEAIKKARKTLSGEQEEAAVLAVKTRFNERAQAVARAQAEAADRAWDIFAKTKRLDAVPPNVLNSMDGKVRLALEKEAQDIAAGRDIRTNTETWDYLTKLAVREPEKFKAIDLRAYWPQLSEADRKHFSQMQVKPDLQNDAATLSQQLSNMHDQMKWGSGDKEKKGEFDRVVTKAIDDEQRIRGTKLNYKERQEIIDRMVLSGEVVSGRWYMPDKDRRLYEVYGTEDAKSFQPDISANDRAAIVERFKQRGIMRPSDEQIMQAYRRWKGI